MSELVQFVCEHLGKDLLSDTEQEWLGLLVSAVQSNLHSQLHGACRLCEEAIRYPFMYALCAILWCHEKEWCLFSGSMTMQTNIFRWQTERGFAAYLPVHCRLVSIYEVLQQSQPCSGTLVEAENPSSDTTLRNLLMVGKLTCRDGHLTLEDRTGKIFCELNTPPIECLDCYILFGFWNYITSLVPSAAPYLEVLEPYFILLNYKEIVSMDHTHNFVDSLGQTFSQICGRVATISPLIGKQKSEGTSAFFLVKLLTSYSVSPPNTTTIVFIGPCLKWRPFLHINGYYTITHLVNAVLFKGKTNECHVLSTTADSVVWKDTKQLFPNEHFDTDTVPASTPTFYQNDRLINYVGEITKVSDDSTLELDGCYSLFLLHYSSYGYFGRGLRVGAVVHLYNAHLVYHMSKLCGFGLCTYSHLHVTTFSRQLSAYEPCVQQTNSLWPVWKNMNIPDMLWLKTSLATVEGLFSNIHPLPASRVDLQCGKEPAPSFIEAFLDSINFTAYSRNVYAEFLSHKECRLTAVRQLPVMLSIRQLEEVFYTKEAPQHSPDVVIYPSNGIFTENVVLVGLLVGQDSVIVLRDSTGACPVMIPHIDPSYLNCIVRVACFSIVAERRQKSIEEWNHCLYARASDCQKLYSFPPLVQFSKDRVFVLVTHKTPIRSGTQPHFILETVDIQNREKVLFYVHGSALHMWSTANVGNYYMVAGFHTTIPTHISAPFNTCVYSLDSGETSLQHICFTCGKLRFPDSPSASALAISEANFVMLRTLHFNPHIYDIRDLHNKQMAEESIDVRGGIKSRGLHNTRDIKLCLQDLLNPSCCMDMYLDTEQVVTTLALVPGATIICYRVVLCSAPGGSFYLTNTTNSLVSVEYIEQLDHQASSHSTLEKSNFTNVSSDICWGVFSVTAVLLIELSVDSSGYLKIHAKVAVDDGTGEVQLIVDTLALFRTLFDLDDNQTTALYTATCKVHSLTFSSCVFVILARL